MAFLSIEKRVNFTLAHMRALAHDYEYLLSALQARGLRCHVVYTSSDSGGTTDAPQPHLPQYCSHYRRTKDLVLLAVYT